MFADKALIARERESDNAHQHDERDRVDCRLQNLEASQAFGPTAHPRRDAKLQQEPHRYYCGNEIPEQKPVAAFKVSVRSGALVRRYRGKISIHSCPNVKGWSGTVLNGC